MKAELTKLTLGNKVGRTVWKLAYFLLYRPTPAMLHAWRRAVLRFFGARVGAGAHPYPKARIWAPWNLRMGKNSCLSNDVECYNVANIILEDDAIVSQFSYLCAAGHDYQDPAFPMVSAPIIIREKAWVAADAFIGPGVIVGEGAVVGARSAVFKDVAPWTVVGGNPAQVIKYRRLPDAQAAHAGVTELS